MKKLAKRFATALCALSFLTCAGNAFAADTNEPLDQGAFEVDPTFSLNNLQAKKYGKPTVATDFYVGYGVLESFTVSGGMSYGTDDGMNGGGLGVDLGLLWTPLDTDNIDLDVMVNFSFDGGYTLTPGVELNYDIEPDQSFLGFYLRLGLPIYGAGYGWDHVDNDGDGHADDAEWESKADVGLSLTLGAYFTFGEIHQILLEGGFAAMNLAKNATKDVRVQDGFLALGYNVQLLETFELTTELSFHFKHEEDEHFWSGISVGGIFGIPNAQ